MTRRRTCPKTRNNKKPQGLNPCAWCAAQESSSKAASSAEKKGRVDTAARQTEEVWDKSSTKELLETVKAPTEGRILERGQNLKSY